MTNGQSYAVEIEHILCRVFACQRYGFAGIVNSDFIRSKPFTAIASGLAYLYATADDTKKNNIERFISDYSFYLKLSIDELLSFESSSKEINGITMELEFDNGKLAIEKIISDFGTLCK
jgi:hypothetical protein